MYDQPCETAAWTYDRCDATGVQWLRDFLLREMPEPGHRRWTDDVPCPFRQLGGGTRPAALLVNRDDAIGYHVDVTTGFPAENVMVMLAHKLTGGEVVLPTLDGHVDVTTGFRAHNGRAFAFQDGWFLAFDGQSLPHGVAPFELGPGGYRISAVYHFPLED